MAAFVSQPRVLAAPVSGTRSSRRVSLGAASPPSTRAAFTARHKTMAFKEEPAHGEQPQQLPLSSPPPPSSPVDATLLAVALTAFLAFGGGVWIVSHEISGNGKDIAVLSEKISGMDVRFTEKMLGLSVKQNETNTLLLRLLKEK